MGTDNPGHQLHAVSNPPATGSSPALPWFAQDGAGAVGLELLSRPWLGRDILLQNLLRAGGGQPPPGKETEP